MSYPLALYNFRVNVDTRSMSFSEVSGITIAYDHVVYRHGLSFWEGEDITTFRLDAYAPISLKRGTIPGGDLLFLHDWLKSRTVRRMEIFLCDQYGSPVMTWEIAKAVPVKLSAPAFAANTNEVAIETLDVQARGVSLVRLQ
jgi:phage tail-like protein